MTSDPTISGRFPAALTPGRENKDRQRVNGHSRADRAPQGILERSRAGWNLIKLEALEGGVR